MRGRVVAFDDAIAARRNYLGTLALDDDGAHRNFTARRRAFGFFQCARHVSATDGHRLTLPGAREEFKATHVAPLSPPPPRHTLAAMSQRPFIGITLDSEESGSYAKLPWYALRQNYCDVVADAGGIPVLLPHTVDAAEACVNRIDGLLISGGDFDVDPSLFGASDRHQTVKTKDRRTAFEVAATKASLADDKPVLGICGGQQLLNVVLGGTLIQHIPDTVVAALAHEQPNPRDEPGHSVSVMADTLLHQLVGADELAVNSAHHQAAHDVGNGVVINALAPDGVVEGIEDPRHRFCLGVQWHPEYLVSNGDRLILDAFVSACR